MNFRFASLTMVTVLALAGAAEAQRPGFPVRRPADVEILVDNLPQVRYAHSGRAYVEAIKGREYAIRLHNPYGVRVAIALSVDGLNTIDAGRTSSRNARKWVLEPYETVVISGWQTSLTEARRFEFTTEARSYAQALGQSANLGLISAVFYRERVPVVSKDAPAITQPAAPSAQGAPSRSQAPAESSAAGADRREADELAATGMGRATSHAVTMVSLNLEDRPAQTVDIRYEFREQLVRLGVLPANPVQDPLARRERARGFEPGFAPVIPTR